MSETSSLLTGLSRHYINPAETFPGGVFLTEVTHGRPGGRRVDALYVGFTAGSGRVMFGHEVKVSRGDWLRELDQPDKSSAWADDCHAWYVVAPSTAVVQPEELPPGWGLMVPNPRGRRFKIVVRATVHEDRTPSWEGLHSVLKAFDTERARLITEAKQRIETDALQRNNDLLEQWKSSSARVDAMEAESLRRKIQGVEEALGCPISDYTGHDEHLTYAELRQVAALVRAARPVRRIADQLTNHWSTPVRQLASLSGQLEHAVAEFQRETARILEPAEPATQPEAVNQ